MTLESLILRISEISPMISWGILIGPPLLAWLSGRIHEPGAGGTPPWKYLYAVLVYLACIPGIFSCVLTAYSLFFLHQNLLTVNLFIYCFPIIGMAATLAVVNGRADWDDLPGVDRLAGLMILMAVSFFAALALYKTRFLIFFGGSFGALLGIAVGCFILLKWGARLVRGSPGPSGNPSSADVRKAIRKHEAELRRMKKRMGVK